MTRELGSRALVESAFAALSFANAHPDLSTYHRRRYELLREQLGADFDLLDAPSERGPDREHWDRSTRRRLLRQALDQALAVDSPFRRYLEAPRVVAEAYQRHGPAIGEAVAVLRSRLLDLAEHLIVQIDPAVASRTTTEADLTSAGLPPEPDPLDYW